MQDPSATQPPPRPVNYQTPHRQTRRWNPLTGVILIVLGLILLTFVGSFILYLWVGR